MKAAASPPQEDKYSLGEIEKIIIDIIDREDHYCIAYSEGQRCCIDPRITKRGYGGEAVKQGLIKNLAAHYEAIIKTETDKARLDELEHIMDADDVWLNFDPEINPISRDARIKELRSGLQGATPAHSSPPTKSKLQDKE